MHEARSRGMRCNRAMAEPLRSCLVTIARDEGPRIGRLLASIAPWVDAMLVLDTGSRDDTIHVATRAGARVERFTWCDDFAAARNAALTIAAADWHLVLDADEWLIEGGMALRALTRAPAKVVGALQLEDHDPAGHCSPMSACSRSWLSRLLPGHVRYDGTIHEQPVHELPVLRMPVRIGHDGYSAGALAAKRGRNRSLLHTALRAAPDDAYLWYQLGKDAQVYEEHADAEDAFSRAATLAPRQAPWWPDLVARRLFVLKRLARHGAGWAFWRKVSGSCSGSPDAAFAFGDLMLDWAARQPAAAAGLLHAAETAWQHCLTLGEQPDLPDTVPGRGSHLAAYNLALLLEGTGRGAAATRLRARYGLDTSPLLSSAR